MSQITDFLRGNNESNFYSILIILLVGLLLFGCKIGFQFETIRTTDAQNMTQIARNIASGEGNITKTINPLSWSVFPTVKNHPNFQYPPLYSYLTAAGFLLFGVKPYVPLLISGLAYLGMSCLAFFIARRLFNQKVGLYAGILIISYHYFLLMGSLARTQSLYLLLILSSCLVVLWSDQQPILLGILSGFSYLTRFNHWFFLIPLIGFGLVKAEEKKSYFLRFMGPFIVILSPYMLRNYFLVGSPFYHHQIYELVSETSFYPGYEINNLFHPPSPWTFAFTHPFTMMTKWFRNIQASYFAIPELMQKGWIILVLAILPFGVLKGKNWSRNQIGIIFVFLGFFLLQALLLSFVRIRIRYFLPVLPIIFIVAGKGFQLFERKSSILVFGSIFLLVVTINLYFSFQVRINGQDNVEKLSKVSEIIPENDLILSNIPQVLSWTSDRKTLSLVPLQQAKKYYPEFCYVLLGRNPEALSSVRKTRKFLRSERFTNQFKLLRGYSNNHYRLFKRTNEFCS